MSFTPGSALYPASNLALLLETKKPCCHKRFSSPQSRHFHPQTLQQQVARFHSRERRRPQGPSSSLLGPNAAMPWLCSRRTLTALRKPGGKGCPETGGRKEKQPHWGCAAGPPTPAGMAQVPLPLPGAPLAPQVAHADPGWLQPSSTSLPLSLNLSCFN